MLKNLSSVAGNKSTIFLLVIALAIGGVGASANSLLNSSSGGYLVCVNSATKVVTHPGTSTCPKGSKKLVLGAQGVAGANGLTGAAGLSGKDGAAGKDGKTLWNGTTDPVSTWGAPGDMFINSATKTLFGPKDLTSGWPAGVSMVGPKGDQGPIGLTGAIGPQGPGGSGPAGAQGPAGTNGTNATIAITEFFLCDGPDADTVANEKCKIGMTGPGGGLIFFVDYNDQYAGFNYFEVAPVVCEASRRWASFSYSSIVGAAGWSSQAVGRGSVNTNAMVAADPAGTTLNNSAKFAQNCSNGSKNDWFLGSIGEMNLMLNNIIGLGEFVCSSYWSSTEDSVASAKYFTTDYSSSGDKISNLCVRPIRSF